MTSHEKSTNIVKLIIAPILYFILSQGIAVVYTIYCTVKLMMQNSGQIMDQQAYINEVMQMVNEKAMIMTLIGAVIAIPVMYFVFYDKKEEKCIRRIAYLFVALFGIGACVTLNVLISISGLPNISKTYQELSKYIYTGNLWLELVTAGLIVPIAEELIFRGIVFKRMKAVMKPALAIIFSSVIFGIVHGNLVQFVYATILGMGMCFVYMRCRNLWAPIIMHMAANIFSVLLSDCKPVAEAMENMVFSAIVILACVVLAVITPIFIIKFTRGKEFIVKIEDEIHQSEVIEQ